MTVPEAMRRASTLRAECVGSVVRATDLQTIAGVGDTVSRVSGVVARLTELQGLLLALEGTVVREEAGR